MIEIGTDIAFVLLGIAAVLALWRVGRGPSLADRILGLDMLALLGIGATGVYAVRTSLFVYVDIAVVLALAGFITTAAFARYILSRDPP